MKIERWNTETDGELTEQAMREKLERAGYSVSRYIYSPGIYFPAHTHSTDKIDAVFSGRFRIVLEGEEVILEAGDSLAVPRGAAHSAEVVGSNAVISFDAVKR